MDATPQAVPPKIAPASSLGFFVMVTAGVVVSGIAAVLFFFNPSSYGFYPVCTFHQLTGLNCPGCGMTRATYALLHGHLKTAFRDNAFYMLLLALSLGRSVWYLRNKRRGLSTERFVPHWAFWTLLCGLLVFTVLRNIPQFSFLSP